MFDHFAKQQSDYKELTGWGGWRQELQKAYQDTLFDDEFMMGVLFLINSDQRKYGSMVKELTRAYASGRNETPLP
jgi:hypothetical protein